MPDLKGRRVLVVGLGETGYAAAKGLLELGALPVVIDSSAAPGRLRGVAELEGLGAEVRLGESVPADLDTFELAVTSPGVPQRAQVLSAVEEAEIELISELELAYRVLDNEIVAVTGTNGKTTTTELLGKIFECGGRKAITCGNIGNPLISLFGRVGGDELLLVEVSSFQLHYIAEFRPKVAVLLNIAPDHYDWHGNIEEYMESKSRIVENQTSGDYLVFNYDDGFCSRIAGRTRATAVGFSLHSGNSAEIWIEKGTIRYADASGQESVLMSASEVSLVGDHNLANVMASAGAAMVCGERPDSIRRAIAAFEGLEHRMELVRVLNGVRFYNDSKATNPHATAQAIKAFDRPAVLILGGRNKGLDFEGLSREIVLGLGSGKVAGVVLMGESAPEISRSLVEVCKPIDEGRVVRVDGMEEAVREAFRLTAGEGIVLLSPACASFDMYADYKDRGRSYKRIVMELEGRGSHG